MRWETCRSGRGVPSNTKLRSSAAGGPIRILVVDGHAVVREGLKRVFERTDGLRMVGEADGFEAALAFRDVPLDVVVIEMGLPGIGVLEAIRQVRAFREGPRIVVFSSCPERHCAARLLNAGATAYVTKTRPVDDLIRAVREAAGGQRYVHADAGLGPHLSRSRLVELHEALSDREFHVLVDIGIGKSVTTVARELGIRPRTIRTYRERILKKLGLRSTAEMIHYVARTGLQPAYVEPVTWSAAGTRAPS